jgi:hypothetical protein
VLADPSRHGLYVAQVWLAAGQSRGAHGNEDHFAGLHPQAQVGGKVQPASLGAFPHQLFQAGLVDGQTTSLQVFDFDRVVVYTNNAVAQVGQTGAGYQPHIASSHDRHVHGRLPLASVLGSKIPRRPAFPIPSKKVGP